VIEKSIVLEGDDQAYLGIRPMTYVPNVRQNSQLPLIRRFKLPRCC